jgi:hypothetical protein
MFIIVHENVAHSQIEQYAAFIRIHRGCCGAGARLCLLSGPRTFMSFLKSLEAQAVEMLPFVMKAPNCRYDVRIDGSNCIGALMVEAIQP